MKLDWKTKEFIGSGGNGKVYKVKDFKGNFYALKTLKKTKNIKAYKRFRDEIKVLNKLKGIDGVINIIDYNLPENLTNKDQNLYYLMPLGVNLEHFLKGKTYTQFYSIILKLAETLVYLHDKNITHRDIKPENILIINNKPVFSDFGLAHFPKKEKVSRLKEKIGAKWTIAPEMERISSASQYKKADIYSFAKTLWILITNEKSGFEGQYIKNSSISIDNYIDLKINDYSKTFGEWKYESLVLLENLLENATDNNPVKRPNALEFLNRLSEWYNTSSVLSKRNKYEWEHFLKKIFPVSIPENSSWTNKNEIFNILKLISNEYDQLNYAFLPEHGGTDITDIKFLTKSKDSFIINDYYVVYPKKLIFESMNNLDFSYFHLELENKKSINNLHKTTYSEFVYLDEKFNFHNHQSNKYKPIQRYLRSSIIVTRKTSILNKIKGNYDGHFGIQSNKSTDEYKNLVLSFVSVYESNVKKLDKVS